MKHFILFVFSFTIFFNINKINAQCFQIQSILVDACAGSQEGQNEMVTFQVGNTALNTANLSVSWPNNTWLGLTQNSSTASDVAIVNATINGCGYLKEPISGVLPANSKVLLVTSTSWSPLAQSFVNLSDTLYIIFQTAGNTNGHFANYQAGGGLRTLTMTFSSPASCSDVVTYDRALLVNQAGNVGAQDGGVVEFTASGVPTYANYGCQAPFIPLSVDAGNNKIVCANTSQTFTATASGSYSSVNWTLGTGALGVFSPNNSLTTTYTPGAGESGTVKLYCTIIKTCGAQTTTVKDSVNLTVLQIPNPVVSASSNTICPGNASILSYLLTNASNTGTTSVLWLPGSLTTPSISVNSTNVYSVQVTNICGSNTATVSVSTVPIPSVTVSSLSPTACAGSTVSLSATSNVGNFNWSNPVSTNSAVVLSSSTTTTGVVTSTNVCGSDSKTYTLTITPIPTISVNNTNVSLCSGQTVTVTANSNATTYTWQPNGTIHTNTISLNTAGVYTVYTSNICGSASATVGITSIAIPTISVASSSPSICLSGQTATLSISGSSGTYSWSSGGTSSTEIVSTPGVYTATVITPSCGSATNSYTISAIPSPSINLSSNSFTACPGNTLNITAISSEGNYAWSGSTNTSSAFSITVSSSTIGVVTTTNGCESVSGNYTITVPSTPTLTVDFSNISLCSGQTTTVTASSSEANYLWTPGSISTNTFLINSAGIYTVSSSNNCFTTTATITVTINSTPTLSISSSSPSLCAIGQTATLSLSGSTGTYNWSDGSNTQTIIVNTPGVYTATVTTPSCGSTTSAYTVNTIVTPTISLSSTSNLLCNGSSATLTASNNMSNEIWSNGSINTSTIIVGSAGTYTVGVSNACGSPTAAITIQSNVTPSLVLIPSSVLICPNETASLTVFGGTAPYNWSNSSNTGSVVTTTGGTVTVTNTNACGTGSAVVVVDIININADIVANPTLGILPVVVSFTNNSSGANSYFWDFGNGNTATTSTVSSETYSVAGTYTVYLTGSNGSCSDIDSIVINVLNEEPTLVIPNVFSPNNDSINDIFRVSGKNISEFNCTIFDRWGLQMFAWTDIKGGWDGRTNGKDVPDGTYFYIINAKSIDDKEIKKQGFISLFK